MALKPEIWLRMGNRPIFRKSTQNAKSSDFRDPRDLAQPEFIDRFIGQNTFQMTGQTGDRFSDFSVRIPTKRSFLTLKFDIPEIRENQKSIISWGCSHLGVFFGPFFSAGMTVLAVKNYRILLEIPGDFLETPEKSTFQGKRQKPLQSKGKVDFPGKSRKSSDFSEIPVISGSPDQLQGVVAGSSAGSESGDLAQDLATWLRDLAIWLRVWLRVQRSG